MARGCTLGLARDLFSVALIGAQVSAVYNHGSRVPGAIIHYEFPRDECKAGEFTDSAADMLFGSLARSPETTCNNGLGVSLANYSKIGAAQVVSTADATNFLAHMSGSSELTIEFWKESAQDNDRSGAALPVVTVGAVADSTANTCASGGNTISYSLTAFETQLADGTTSARPGGELEFRYYSLSTSVSCDQACKFCPDLTTANSPSPANTARNFTHSVVTIADGSTADTNTVTWYLNGIFNKERTSVGSGEGDKQLADMWQYYSNSHHLQLFGDTQLDTFPWLGSVWAVAIYNRSLTASEVAQNYEAKLPDSPPVPISHRATVNEDGMSAAVRKDSSIYEGGVAVENLDYISLSASDQDEVEGYPNYNATDSVYRPMMVWVATLPTQAALYDYTNGTSLDSAPVQIPPVYEDLATGMVYTQAEAIALGSSLSASLARSYRMRVRPAKDATSPTDGSGNLKPMDNFTFYAVDGVTGVQSTDVATCHLVVSPMNDPPITQNFRVFVAAGVTTIIPFNSSDVDNTLPFKNAYITKYPTNGVLMPVASNGNISECLVDDPEEEGVGKSWVAVCTNPCNDVSSINASNTTTLNSTSFTNASNVTSGSANASNANISNAVIFANASNCTSGVAVAYLLTNWSALADSSAPDGVIGYDSFEYVVEDEYGFNSSVSTATLLITSPLVASTVSTLASAPEESATYVWLAGRDYSTDNHPLQVAILSVPQHGSLVDPATNLTLKAGDILATGLEWPSVSQVGVIYTGEKDYFNQPNTAWDGSSIDSGTDSFTFRVETSDDSGLHSPAATQEIAVINVNDPSILFGPGKNGSFEIFATSLSYGFEERPDYPQILTIEDLELIPDGDEDVDLIKVHIKCTSGKFSINSSLPTTLEELDFDSPEYCGIGQELPCMNAYGDRFSETIFLGPSSVVAQALNGLQYWSNSKNYEDHCSIVVYDGAGEDCMALSMLEDRRDGTHSSDSSGSSSVYTRDGSGAGGIQCYASNVTWTVAVGDFPYRHWCQSSIGVCFSLRQVLGAFFLLIILCFAGPIYCRSKVAAFARASAALAMYDSDSEEDDVNDEAGSEGPIGPRAKLFFHNDPSTWLRLSSAESADAYGKGYEQDARECERSDKVFYYNVKTGHSQWERPCFSLGAPVSSSLLTVQGAEDNPLEWMEVDCRKDAVTDKHNNRSSHQDDDADSSNPLVQRQSTPSMSAKDKKKYEGNVSRPRSFFYNTTTKRKTWTAPRFSSNWEVDEESGAAVGLGPRHLRANGGSRFVPVFGVSAVQERPTARNTRQFQPKKLPGGPEGTATTEGMTSPMLMETSPTLSRAGRQILKSTGSQPAVHLREALHEAKGQHMWDRSSPFTGKGDPGRVLGAFTVDGFDERSQTFADAARQLREETDWESGSGAPCVVSLAALKARATLELHKRRGGDVEEFNRTTRSESWQAPQQDEDDTSKHEEADFGSSSSSSGSDATSHHHRVASAYTDQEVKDVLNYLELRGFVQLNGGLEQGEGEGNEGVNLVKEINFSAYGLPATRLQQRNAMAQRNNTPRNQTPNTAMATPRSWSTKKGISGPSSTEGML